MTVNIDPSEVRAGTSPAPAPTRLGLPLRTVLISGIGGAALIAFTVGAFSFFSTLADPRARKPRPMPAAASMPDLKDGMPALVDGNLNGSGQKTATLNLPRPITAEPATPEPRPVEPSATAPAVAEQSDAVRAASTEVPVPAPIERAASHDGHGPGLRAGPTPPPIQNAATVRETRTADIVAPPARPVATIAPARAETVKAKPVQVSAAVVHTPSRVPETTPEPTSTATVAAPSAVVPPARKSATGKPPVQKTATRNKASSKAVADATPDDAPAPVAASAPAEDNEVPGARQFRAGVKAISGIFGGDSKED